MKLGERVLGQDNGGLDKEALDLESWREFLATKVEAIPGWLHVEAALLTAQLSAAQHAAGLRGDLLEIGVYKGKYLSVLCRASAPGEKVVGIDLFIGAEDAAMIAMVTDSVCANIAAACGDAARLEILVADSLALTVPELRARAKADSFRFISIDGGHTREVVYHDLELASAVLADGGIIALDDAFNHTTPGVIEGITEFFFRNKPALAPFAHCYNKLFVTTPSHHARYLQQTLAMLEAIPWLGTHERTLSARRGNKEVGFTSMMFGYEIVPFL